MRQDGLPSVVAAAQDLPEGENRTQKDCTVGRTLRLLLSTWHMHGECNGQIYCPRIRLTVCVCVCVCVRERESVCVSVCVCVCGVCVSE